MMLTKEFAETFARDWIAAWNAHDIERVLAHYRDDFAMQSPYIIAMADEPSGKLAGKSAVCHYWQTALQRLPELHFELIDTLIGIDSVVIYYRGVRGMAAEIFFFDSSGLVRSACAHYA